MLRTMWSATDTLHNYKTIRDILLKGFGTVEEVPDWSPAKDMYGYGLLKMVGKKRKIPSYAMDGYEVESLPWAVCWRH